MMLRAMRDEIVVEKDTYVPTMERGIYIPEKSDRTPRFAPTIQGTVLSAGPKTVLAKPGDRVYLRIYAGDDYYFDDKKVTLLREKDLVGIIDHE